MGALIYIGSVIVLLLFKVWWDWRAKNKKKRIIDHLQSVLLDGLGYLISASVFLYWMDGYGLKVIVGSIIMSAGFRWLFFDLLFNLVNGDDWNHYGESSKLDKWLIKLGKWHLIPKFVLIGIGITLIIWQI